MLESVDLMVAPRKGGKYDVDEMMARGVPIVDPAFIITWLTLPGGEEEGGERREGGGHPPTRHLRAASKFRSSPSEGVFYGHTPCTEPPDPPSLPLPHADRLDAMVLHGGNREKAAALALAASFAPTQEAVKNFTRVVTALQNDAPV